MPSSNYTTSTVTLAAMQPPQALPHMGDTERHRLSEQLLQALRKQDMQLVDDALCAIEAACERHRQSFFDMPIKQGCQLHRTIKRRASLLGLQTEYWCYPNGVTEETLLPPLTAQELRTLWEPVRMALLALDRPAGDNAVRRMVSQLREMGYSSVTLPVEPLSLLSGRVVKAWLRVRHSREMFHFEFNPAVLAPLD